MRTLKKIKQFKVETNDGGAIMIFFTQAFDHKKALRNLQTNSQDYKRICNSDTDLIIKITELK